MPIVRCTLDDVDTEKLLADLRAARPRTEAAADPDAVSRALWGTPTSTPGD